jgi:hypothetical protein
MITPGLGANSKALCVNPTPNFTIGFAVLGLGVAIIAVYIFRGRFESISFRRKVLVIQPLVELCTEIQSFLLQNKLVKSRKTSKLGSRLKIFIFLIIGIVVIAFTMIGLVILTFYQTVFNAMIIWRGLHGVFELPSFNLGIKSLMRQISQSLSIPTYVMEAFFYPLFLIVQFVATLNIDMSQISVTCEGSKAPFDLLMNFGILGISLSIIVTGYQYVWQVTLPTLNQAVFDYILTNEQFHFDWNMIKLMLNTVALSLDPFQMFTRYLMTLSTLGKFLENDGMHSITKGCDSVSGGLDSILGYSTSMVAWCIYLPLIYLFANSVVPNYLPLKYKTDNLMKALRRDKVEKTNPFEPKKEKSADKDNTSAILLAKKTKLAKIKATPREIFTMYRNWAGEYVIFFVSVDLLLSHYARRWVRFIARIHGIPINEDKLNAVFQKGNHNKLVHQPKQQKRTLLQKLHIFDRERHQVLLEDHKMKTGIHGLQLKHAWEFEAKNKMPTYWELCCLVRDELLDLPIFKCHPKSVYVVSPLSIIGVVHFLTKVGRAYWYLAMRKVYLFLSICVGRWNDETYEAFRIKEIAKAVNPDKENVEETYIKVMAITVATRVSIFQIIGVMSVFTIVCTAISSSPLFVSNKHLNHSIPPLVIKQPYKEALRREIKLLRRRDPTVTQFNERIHRWVLYLKAFSIFLGESRLLVFVNNVLVVSLSLATISYKPGTEFVILSLLILLIPFFLSKLSIFIILLGKTLKVEDKDMYVVFGIFSKDSQQLIVGDVDLEQEQPIISSSSSAEIELESSDSGSDSGQFDLKDRRLQKQTGGRLKVKNLHSTPTVKPDFSRASVIDRFQAHPWFNKPNRVAPILAITNDPKIESKCITSLDIDFDKLIEHLSTPESYKRSNSDSLLLQMLCDDLTEDSNLDEAYMEELEQSVISKLNRSISSDQSYFESDFCGLHEPEESESGSDYSMTYVSEVLDGDQSLVDYLDSYLCLSQKGPYSFQAKTKSKPKTKSKSLKATSLLETEDLTSWLEDQLASGKNSPISADFEDFEGTVINSDSNSNSARIKESTNDTSSISLSDDEDKDFQVSELDSNDSENRLSILFRSATVLGEATSLTFEPNAATIETGEDLLDDDLIDELILMNLHRPLNPVDGAPLESATVIADISDLELGIQDVLVPIASSTELVPSVEAPPVDGSSLIATAVESLSAASPRVEESTVIVVESRASETTTYNDEYLAQAIAAQASTRNTFLDRFVNFTSESNSTTRRRSRDRRSPRHSSDRDISSYTNNNATGSELNSRSRRNKTNDSSPTSPRLSFAL